MQAPRLNIRLPLCAVLAALCCTGAYAQGAATAPATAVASATQAAPAAPIAAGARSTDPAKPLGFFVTSAGPGKGADFGGIAGADAHCQQLAASVGSGGRIWRAYLSIPATDGKPAINARDRIGSGPWYNTRGVAIARDVGHLHGDTVDEARLGNNISKATALTEKNEPVKGAGDSPNQHDIVTGSLPDGRAYTDGADHTCSHYTSSAAAGSVQVGHVDRTGGGNISWNSTHPSRGCGQANLVATGGAGLLYCFAAN